MTMVVPGGALSGAGAALMAAAVSYLFTSLHTLRTEQHKDLVGRVGDQLKEFYGPLLACITASKESCARILAATLSPECGSDRADDCVAAGSMR